MTRETRLLFIEENDLEPLFLIRSPDGISKVPLHYFHLDIESPGVSPDHKYRLQRLIKETMEFINNEVYDGIKVLKSKLVSIPLEVEKVRYDKVIILLVEVFSPIAIKRSTKKKLLG